MKSWIKVAKITSSCGAGVVFIFYHVHQTYKYIQTKIVNPSVLDREKTTTPEYIYIDDPSYTLTLQKEKAKETQQVGLARIWKSLKYSLAWRLLWLCRHGNREQRNTALEQLAAFKNNKQWDCLKLAQAMDKNTAVLLARTRDVDLRYFLPPPVHVRRAALAPELISYNFIEMISAVQSLYPHSCSQHFLHKHFVNLQEHSLELDSVPPKPDNISDKDLCILCLDVIHHHISLYKNKVYSEDIAVKMLINMSLLPKLAELMLRYHHDTDVDYAVLRLLTDLSVHANLLTDFFQNGLIGQLARLLKSKDVRLSSSAAVCLVNLSGECCYRQGLYLLHPLHRTKTPHTKDVLLVHGLRGGVFVTWRQRDKNCGKPLGFLDVTVASSTDKKIEANTIDTPYLDPEIKQVIEDYKEMEDEVLLSDIEVVLHDIPIDAKREPECLNCTTIKKRSALNEEEEDRMNYTFCWPKDWLPNDCDNLRILGINYWSCLSEWLEKCPMQTADIATRAENISTILDEATVGHKNVPIVWLAHSMGGLIVKQMLVKSSQSTDDNLKRLADNTKSVLFFSTPHKGSSLATMPRPAAAVIWPSSDVRQLKVNSPVLLDLHSNFLKAAEKHSWEIISFAETMPTLVTAFKVPIQFVEVNSADVGRGVFYKLPLDHLCICKPATRQSIIYTTVLDVLQRASSTDQLKSSISIVQRLINVFNFIIQYFKSRDIIESSGSRDHQKELSLDWLKNKLIDTFSDF